jgi:dipeptidase D
MLNLDSEEDDSLCIGCAGGCDTNVVWKLSASDAGDAFEFCRVSVSGLRGGHSGCDIHEGRSNAIKLLVRTLQRVPGGFFQLGSISGGSKRNAIPREAAAVIACTSETGSALKKAAQEMARNGKTESYEPEVTITVERGVDETGLRFASVDDTARVLSALAAFPSGPLGMHPKVPGLVETSNNVSTVNSSTSGNELRVDVGMLSRSSSNSRIREVVDQLAAIGSISNGQVTTANEYPGWPPNPDSPTLAVCTRLYEEMFGSKPEVGAVHAGLECGIIGERVGGLDAVSLGPNIKGAHSPDERVYVASVERTWEYLVKLLEELANA